MTKYDTQGAFDKLHEDPFLPPVPAPRKSYKGWIIGAALVASLGIGMAIQQGSTTETLGTEATPVAAGVIEDPVSTGLTPAMLVDSLDPSLVGEFCSAFAGIDPSVARMLWTQAYNEELAGQPGIPSESALWYEMTSRC